MSNRGWGVVGAVAFWALAAEHCVGDSNGITDSGADQTAPDGAALTDAQADTNNEPDACAACDSGTCFEGVCGGNAVVQVSTGAESSCVLLQSGSVWCWGQGTAGQLGVDPATLTACGETSTGCRATPAEVAGINDVKEISQGRSVVCAIKNDNSVWCWGSNNSGQLGHDPGKDPTCGTSACNWKPTQVVGLSATHISAGFHTTCVITSAGGVSCWGADGNGELGDGQLNPNGSYLPVTNAVLTQNTQHVCAGVYGACAQKSDGTVWCWGGSNLGHPVGTNGDWVDAGNVNPTPARVGLGPNGTDAGLISDAVNIECGTAGLALRAGGSVSGWGFGDYGEYGLAYVPGDFESPVPVTGLPQMMAVSDHLASGAGSACGIATDHSVWCWGVNQYGELGDGTLNGNDAGVLCTNTSSNEVCKGPEKMNGVLATSINVTNGTSGILLKIDGTVWAWGYNGNGRLGHTVGQQGDQSCPTSVGSSSTAVCNPTIQQITGLP